MRFLIEYKDFDTKEEKNKSLSLLDTFLNEHLIGLFHGHTFECILIRFISNAPIKKKFKLKSLYKTIAEIEIKGNFSNNEKLNICDFNQGLSSIEEAIKRVPQIEIKEELDFDEIKLIKDFKKIVKNAPQSEEELKNYAKKEEKIRYINTIKRVDCLMYSYKINPKPLNKNIIGVRLYDHFERNTLLPYSYIYSQLFSNLLRRAEVKTPGYEEIYFSVAETLEQAKQSFSLESWHKYTYSTLNLSEYIQQDEDGKAKMVFNSMCCGLRMITEFDHLEKEKIEDVIEYIDRNGMNTELVYTTAQNKYYRVEVIYHVPHSHLSRAEFKLRLTNISDHSTGIVNIDQFDIDYAPFSVGKIQINKNEIVIKGRSSLRAEISRKFDKLPLEYRFSINEILNKKDSDTTTHK